MARHACRLKDHIARNGERGAHYSGTNAAGRLPALDSWRSSNEPLQNSLVMEIEKAFPPLWLGEMRAPQVGALSLRKFVINIRNFGRLATHSGYLLTRY